MTSRFLDVPGAFNVRHLGGFTAGDGVVRPEALLRSDALDEVEEAGWDVLTAHGVSTVIDLRNDDEKKPVRFRPPNVKTIEIALDGVDEDFWRTWGDGPQFGTALYYRPHLQRFSSLHAEVVSAIAFAPEGSVVIHCSVGRDRTGLVVAEVLTLLGARLDDIVEDYALSETRLAALYEHRSVDSQTDVIRDFLAERNLTPRLALREAFTELPLREMLEAGGLRREALARLEDRCLTQP